MVFKPGFQNPGLKFPVSDRNWYFIFEVRPKNGHFQVYFKKSNISSFVEFQRWWVLKSKIFTKMLRGKNWEILQINDASSKCSKIVLWKSIFHVKNCCKGKCTKRLMSSFGCTFFGFWVYFLWSPLGNYEKKVVWISWIT